ncbi:hypothetical protein BKA62DRAFT_700438 [Auriculariales sp. MPI-PUGE-AT-0066]|nr:hypothetical protein BKA62DRAFT_700438 [Auriculariales sp. MPI-PUGE-AT-0066]
MHLYGRKVTFNVIPAYTGAGAMRMSKLWQIAHSVRGLQNEIANHCKGDPKPFWHLIIDYVPACQPFLDEYLSVLMKRTHLHLHILRRAESCPTVPFKESDVHSGPTAPLVQYLNISTPAEQLHNVPAEALSPAPSGQALTEPEPEVGIPSTQVTSLPRKPPRHVTFATPAAVSGPTAGPSKRNGRTKQNQRALADPVVVALSSKVDQVTRSSAKTKTNSHGFIPKFKCFFCGWSGKKPDSRTDQANNHRTGGTIKPCKVFVKLGGAGNLPNVASFLLARWPELLNSEFEDDQLNGNLQKALAEDWDGSLSRRALDALATFAKTNKSPPAGVGYWDPELVKGKATMVDVETEDELTENVEDEQMVDAMMEDVESEDEPMEDDGE